MLSNDPTENWRNSTSGILSTPFLTQILVVRHAEVHNPGNILYGRLPRFGLSEKGYRQAEEAGRFTSARSVTAIYSSPLLRARQTAAVISRYHPRTPVRFSRKLLEVRTSYQGKPNTILKPGFSFYHPVNDPADETMDDIFGRIISFLRLIIRRHPGETVVAVSHADPIVIMRMGLQALPFTNEELHRQVYPDRASVNQLTVHGPHLALEYFAVAAQ